MSDNHKFTGIILAGGKSSRLGQEKGLLLFKGITLAERAVSILEPFCDRILIITSNPSYQKNGIELIPDLESDKGPMMGIYSGLAASRTKSNLVIAVDNCFVGSEYYSWIIDQIEEYQAIISYVDDKFYEPLVGYYSRDIMPLMERSMTQGNYKLPDLLDSAITKRLKVQHDFPAYHPAYFNSINLPGDLDLLVEKL